MKQKEQTPGPGPLATTKLISTNIRHDADGKWRWAYDFSLYRNPTILKLLWKILIFIVLGMFLFMMLLEMIEGNLQDRLLDLVIVFGALLVGLLLLASIAYLTYAVIMGGKYSVLFEMDDAGVNHIQLRQQFEKSRILSFLSAMAGAASGRPGAVAPGLLAATKQSTYSRFSQVRALQADRRHAVIKLRTRDLVHNQVYARPEDFDAVLTFIQSRIPEQATTKIR